MEMLINGVESSLSDYEANDLARAVVISLFSWRRASLGEVDAGESRMGWWGDTFERSPIGSKLWLLMRQKMTQETLSKAKEYGEEALKWLLEDGIASDVAVKVERFGFDGLTIEVEILRPRQQKLTLRFKDVWEQGR